MRTYLEVPYQDKDKVKAIGARFDMSIRRWYVPDGIDLFDFLEWVPNLEVNSKVKKALKRKR